MRTVYIMLTLYVVALTGVAGATLLAFGPEELGNLRRWIRGLARRAVAPPIVPVAFTLPPER